MGLRRWLKSGKKKAAPGDLPRDVTAEHPVSLANARFKGACRIGRFTYVNHSANIESADIGRFCSIGEGAVIGPPVHPLDRISTHPFSFTTKLKPFSTEEYARLVPRENDGRAQRTSIGHDVWIGTRAIILSGISIGHGAVVGAGAVVTRNVPPYAIVAGVPAILRRMRFPPEIVDRLLWLGWWDYAITRDELGDARDGIELVLQRLETLKEAGKLKPLPPFQNPP